MEGRREWEGRERNRERERFPNCWFIPTKARAVLDQSQEPRIQAASFTQVAGSRGLTPSSDAPQGVLEEQNPELIPGSLLQVSPVLACPLWPMRAPLSPNLNALVRAKATVFF